VARSATQPSTRPSSRITASAAIASGEAAPGSLDDPDRFLPRALTDSVRGLAWDAIDPSLPAFERMPTG